MSIQGKTGILSLPSAAIMQAAHFVYEKKNLSITFCSADLSCYKKFNSIQTYQLLC